MTMSVVQTKTKAEQALIAHFEAHAADLPGGDELMQARRDAIGAFETLGLPHRRIEEWKYTDLRAALKDAPPPATAKGEASAAPDDAAIDAQLGMLGDLSATRLLIVDGRFDTARFSGDLPPGLTVRAISDHAADLPQLAVSDSDAILALNTAFMSDGVVIDVAARADIKMPVLIVHVRAGADERALTTRNVISIGAQATATVIEAFITVEGAAGGLTNAASEVRLGDHAELTHLKITSEGQDVTHAANGIAELGTEAEYRAFQVTRDAALVRNNLYGALMGEGAKIDVSGVMLGRGQDHHDTTLVIDHAVPGCESRELFKAVLDDTARAVFQGKVIVQPDAQKSDGKQMAQALMLSPTCEFDSKPELEIYADDVVCGHGSTVAELDADLLFYLRARGIPEATARGMLIDSFVAEALEKVDNEEIRDALRDASRRWLHREDA
ncbi:MAG: Fe-S cluster assembly protein SufD [Pseudomonadota bacterium]